MEVVARIIKMAKTPPSVKNILLILVLNSIFKTGGAKVLDATTFLDSLATLTVGGAGVTILQEHVDENLNYNAESIDGTANIASLASSLESNFADKFMLAKNLKDAVESEYGSLSATAAYPECCKVKTTEENYNSKYRSEVLEDQLCARISGSAGGIIKHANQAIMDAFTQNVEDVPGVKWQYYGTEEGILYGHPASKVAKDQCGSYDPRFRPWYVATATSKPKDVVLVFDRSNAMAASKLTGLTFYDIAKNFVATLLDSLSPKDRFGLIAFSDEASTPHGFVDGCFASELASASPYNKEAMTKYLDTLAVAGNADYVSGINKAFELLDGSTTTGDEDRVIVLISGSSSSTDKGAVNAAITSKNADFGNEVTVSTFFITGGHADGADTLEAMTTATAEKPGVYTVIEDGENIRKSMGDFFQALHSPIKDKVVISQPYYDAFGLGIITTVSMPIFDGDTFVGVVGIDVTLFDLFSEVRTFKPGKTSYVFVVDTVTGETLTHPLIPEPTSVSVDPVVISIDLLERDIPVASVIDSIMARETGSSSATSTRTSSRGDTYREGVSQTSVASTYYYAPVEGTNFAVCLVVGSSDVQSTLSMVTPPTEDEIVFQYHVHSESGTCRHFFRECLEESSTVKFAPKAFSDPFTYLDGEEAQETIDSYFDVLKMNDLEGFFVDGVISDVHITALMDKEWKEGGQMAPNLVPHAVWRYVGTQHGVIRVYPGIQLTKNYDPTARSWYKRALSYYGKRVVSAPYLDAFGSGFVVTISQVIQGPANVGAFGVVGMDLGLPYMYYILKKRYNTCDQPQYTCFLIDSAGYVVIHPKWIEADWTETPSVENQHITTMEPEIAEHMITSGFMIRKQCVNLYQVRDQDYFEVVQTGVDRMDEDPFYEAEWVPESNIYLIVKDTNQAANAAVSSCDCFDMDAPEPPRCRTGINGTCECPCYSDADFQSCTNTYRGSDWKPCTPVPMASASVGFDISSEDAMSKSECFPQTCSRRKNAGECDTVALCRWCDRKHPSGSPIGNPYCGDYDDCFFGQTNHPSPYAKTGGGSPVGVIVAIVVVLAALGGGGYGAKIFYDRYKFKSAESREMQTDDIRTAGGEHSETMAA